MCVGSDIGPIVGGAIAGILAVVVIIFLIMLLVWLVKRRKRSKYNLSKASQLEMGTRKPSKPILGGKWGEGKGMTKCILLQAEERIGANM